MIIDLEYTEIFNVGHLDDLNGGCCDPVDQESIGVLPPALNRGPGKGRSPSYTIAANSFTGDSGFSFFNLTI